MLSIRAEFRDLTLTSSRMSSSFSSRGGAASILEKLLGAFPWDGPAIVWAEGVGGRHLKAGAREDGGRAKMTITLSSTFMGIVKPSTMAPRHSSSFKDLQKKVLPMTSLGQASWTASLGMRPFSRVHSRSLGPHACKIRRSDLEIKSKIHK